MTKILTLTIADLDEVMAIENTVHRYKWSKAVMQDCINKHQAFKICAQNSGEILGYSVLQIILDEAHLLTLSIKKEYQGAGLGHKLLRFTLREALAQKAVICFLEVESTNTQALNLYLKQGFNEIGKRLKYYWNAKFGSSDALVMALNLDYIA